MTPAEFHRHRKFVATEFGRIAYHDQGEGSVALFLHGVPLNGYQWSGVIDRVAEHRRCVAPDLMGFGYTEAPQGAEVSLGAQARMVGAFLDALGVETVDLCGNDTGGGVSQIFAATRPQRVRTLTLTNVEVHDLWPNARALGFFQQVKSGAFTAALERCLGDLPLARRVFGGVFGRDYLTTDLVDMYFCPLVATEERRGLVRRFGLWERSFDELLEVASLQRAATTPAQIVWGDADTAFDMAASIDWLRSNLGGLTGVHIVRGGNLFFMAEDPSALTPHLIDFWRRAP